MRRNIELGGLLGTGIQVKIPHGYIFGELQFQPGITARLDPSGQKEFTDLAYREYYLSDNFRINKLGFNVGYSYSFYKPIKKK
jgi:hypothetical protein